MEKEIILSKLKDLRREETEERTKASVYEAIDTLIESVEFLIKCQPERLSPEDAIKSVYDSLNSENK